MNHEFTNQKPIKQDDIAVQQQAASVNADDEGIETLPIRAAQAIVQHILSNNSLRTRRSDLPSANQVFEELQRAIGRERLEDFARVRELQRRQRTNEKLDKQFSDTPDPIILVKSRDDEETGGALRDEFTGKQRHTQSDSALDNFRAELLNRTARPEDQQQQRAKLTSGQRFANSKLSFEGELTSQRRLLSLFDGKAGQQPVDTNQPIRLTEQDERPSQQEVEQYRGDRDAELTDADRALAQAESYMNKYLDYMSQIRSIQKLEHIPGSAQRKLMLENFYQFLRDARYYQKFYHKYSGFWAPEATKTIESYKGLYVPIDKRREDETYHYDEQAGNFEPLRRLIFQDFHDRVRKGLPPSLDLQGQLPALAMYYTRTTFVPPLTDAEMQQIFYPSVRPFPAMLPSQDASRVPFKSYEPPRFSYVSQDPIRSCLQNHAHFSRYYSTQYCASYDSSSDTWYTYTAAQLLDTVDRLLYLLGNTQIVKQLRGDKHRDIDDMRFPQHFHCIWLLHGLNAQLRQQANMEFVTLACSAVMLGLPFITSIGNSPSNETSSSFFKKLMDQVADYAQCGLLASMDDELATLLARSEFAPLIAKLGIQSNLLYSSSEPHTTTLSIKGRASYEDPVSPILRSTRVTVRETTEHRRWSPQPQQQNDGFRLGGSSRTKTLILHYKQLLSGTKGVSQSTLHKSRDECVARADAWDNSVMQLVIDLQDPSQPPRAVLRDNFHAVIQQLNEQLKPLLDAIAAGSNAKVLIALGTDTPALLHTVFLCLLRAIPFAIVPSNSSAKELLRHINTTNSSVVIASTRLLVEVVNSATEKELNEHLQGVLAISSSSLGIDTGFHNQWKRISSVSFVYSIVYSEQLFAPLAIVDHSQAIQWNEGVLNMWNAALVAEPNTSIRKVEVDGYVPQPCMPLIASYQEKRKAHEHRTAVDEVVELLRSGALVPADIRRSFAKLQELKNESSMYYRILAALDSMNAGAKTVDLKREKLDSLNDALQEALVDELRNVIPSGEIDSIFFDDLQRFLVSRTQLTDESLSLQNLDFDFRCETAKRQGQIRIKNAVQPPRPIPLPVSKDQRTVLSDVYLLGNTSTGGVLFGTWASTAKIGNELVDLNLLEILVEEQSKGLVQRCFFDWQEQKQTLRAVMFTSGKAITASQWEQTISSVHKLLEKYQQPSKTAKTGGFLSLLIPVQKLPKDHAFLPRFEDILVIQDFDPHRLDVFDEYGNFDRSRMGAVAADLLAARHGSDARASRNNNQEVSLRSKM